MAMERICTENAISEYKFIHAPYNYCWKQKGILVSEWITASGTQPAIQITMEYPFDKSNTTPDGKIADDTTLILTLSVEFEKPVYGNLIEPVEYAGTGKVIRVGLLLAKKIIVLCSLLLI